MTDFSFFWSKSHPYNNHFLIIYVVPDTIFLARVRDMKNIPLPLESSLSSGADGH